MRTLVFFILIVSVLGGAFCARLRRQAPPAPISADKAADLDGPPEGISTSDYTGVTGYADAKGNMLNDMNNQAGMGVPIPSKKIDDMLKMFMI